MFIYFPEFLYKSSKLIFNSTFSKISKQDAEIVIASELKSDRLKPLIHQVKQKNLKLPSVKFSHCLNIARNSSYYDQLTNTIELCLNKLNSLQEVQDNFTKQISYFYDFNIMFKHSEINFQDLACLSIRACHLEQENHFKSRSNNLKEELTKRCAYSSNYLIGELAKVYEKEEVFELTKNYVDQNINRCFRMQAPFESFFLTEGRIVSSIERGRGISQVSYRSV